MVKFSLRTRPALYGAIIAVLIGVGAYAYTHAPLPDVVVLRTPDGFKPSTITIKKGQAVVFKSTAGQDFWPASDFHPTHTLYPEFDPKHAIKPDQSWRFVFDKPGVWTYHDHMSEYIRGTIIVNGAPGESTAACLSRTSASSSPELRAQCWAADLTETLQNKGLSAAFDLYASLYQSDASFRGLACHDAGHILGAAAYKSFTDKHTVIDRPETSYCGYGFYHGFIEAMLVDQGPSQYARVRSYCDALKSGNQLNNASGACYHGIGHAAFDSIPGDEWGDDAKMVRTALDVCEHAAIGTPERAQCSSGVYNALAVAKSAHSYELSFNASDPAQICEAQPQAYRNDCYLELGIGVIRERGYDRAATMRFIQSLQDRDGALQVLFGYMGDEVARAITSIKLPEFYSFCNALSGQERSECHRGVLIGLRQAGAPGQEYPLMFAYCSLYAPGADQSACYSLAITQTKTTASNTAAFQEACLAIPDTSARTQCY